MDPIAYLCAATVAALGLILAATAYRDRLETRARFARRIGRARL